MPKRKHTHDEEAREAALAKRGIDTEHEEGVDDFLRRIKPQLLAQHEKAYGSIAETMSRFGADELAELDADCFAAIKCGLAKGNPKVIRLYCSIRGLQPDKKKAAVGVAVNVTFDAKALELSKEQYAKRVLGAQPTEERARRRSSNQQGDPDGKYTGTA